jgi:hypothetical protein
MSGVQDVSSGRKSGRPEPGSAKLSVIVAIIVAVIVIALVIFMVIWGTSGQKKKNECVLDADCGGGKVCRNGKCESAPTCTAPPQKPSPVTVVYDREVGTATVSWGPVTGAMNYKLYRKLGDPSVSKSNYDERTVLYGTAHTYTNLETGTHYFAVTCGNECGDSDESSPAVLAPSCDVIPLTPGAPLITQTTDTCSNLTEPVEINALAHDEATGTNPFNLVRGNGQFGVDDYFAAFPSPTGDFSVALKCSGQPVSYNVTAISMADYAQLTYPTGPMALGATLPVTWETLLGAEEYAVTLVAVTVNGTYQYIGGTTSAPDTSLTVTTPDGSTLIFASVIGYRLCDKSSTSNAGFHIPPTGP